MCAPPPPLQLGGGVVGDSGRFYKFGTPSPPSAPEYSPSCYSEFEERGFHSDEEMQKVGGNTGMYLYMYVYCSNCVLVCTALCCKLRVYNRVQLLVCCTHFFVSGSASFVNFLYRLAMR